MLGIFLSIAFPGLGQLYYGKNGRGVAMVLLGITPLYPVALIWSVIDVISLNKQGLSPKFERKEAIWSVILILVIIPGCFFILAFGSFTLFNRYLNEYSRPRATIEEGNIIVTALSRYKKESGHYPEDLQTLINGNPIRSRWTSDAWGQRYFYEVTDNQQNFKLVSKGKDRSFGTEDDIIFNN